MSFSGLSIETQAAADRFREFFRELEGVFVERDDLLTQIALALLGREHVLMTGPPGTAKSNIAAAVLGRIIDERTGQPSVYARQFTESTVQTDLVGPIDFKTLMQTGRTEHFTDEGMLGAVHAFLDEVLDGRDMLLRTTLNVLHERELKQGTKTTSGAIECALMTTNRYLSEVLEGSRETLLAFIDRVAFVSFVPKGFVEAGSLEQVLRSQVGSAKPRSLSAQLSIQDIDLLQHATEQVMVSDELCAALCQMLGQLELELSAASKHDPSFLPTRYLSTRTAVRLTRLLRSICVLDIIMGSRERGLSASFADLHGLRLSLLLSGPRFEKIASLLERETDPRERRQLSILRTEREIFERVFARLPKPKAPAPAPKNELAGLAREVEQLVEHGGETQAALATAVKIAEIYDGGGAGSAEAKILLERTLDQLAERAARAGLMAGLSGDEDDSDLTHELAELADGLEKASGQARPVARWLRGRAIGLLVEQAMLAGVGLRPPAVDDSGRPPLDASPPSEVLEPLERLVRRIAQLRAAGADASDLAGLPRALLRVQEELRELWDISLQHDVTAALARVGSEQLGPVLAALAPVFGHLDAYGQHLADLAALADPLSAPEPSSLKTLVVGPRLLPLIGAAFERLDPKDRLALVDDVAILVAQLQGSGLRGVVPSERLLEFACQALIRSERKRVPVGEEGAEVAAGEPPEPDAGYELYLRQRSAEQRISIAYVVVELALRVAHDKPHPVGSPERLVAGITEGLSTLPEAYRAQIIELDLARIDRALSLLERWWAPHAVLIEAALTSGQGQALTQVSEQLQRSRFFEVIEQGRALVRFATEARLIASVFAESEPRVALVRARIDTLRESSSRLREALARARADQAWGAIFQTSAG